MNDSSSFCGAVDYSTAINAMVLATNQLELSQREYDVLLRKYKDVKKERNESLKTSQNLKVQLDAANKELAKVRDELATLKVFKETIELIVQQSSRASEKEIAMPYQSAFQPEDTGEVEASQFAKQKKGKHQASPRSSR